MSGAATNQFLTWSAFKANVDKLLSTDADRLSEGTEKDSWIKDSLLEMQELVPSLREGHQSIFLPADTAPDGHCSRLVLPPGTITAVHIIRIEKLEDKKTDSESKHGVTKIGFNQLDHMRHGRLDVSSGDGYICVDPQGYTAWVYPEIKANMMVTFWWNGQKSDFKDDDETPFDAFVAGAVAYYMRAEMRRGIEEEIQLHNSFRQSYVQRRRAIYRRHMDRI